MKWIRLGLRERERLCVWWEEYKCSEEERRSATR
jgi:hypothetical protein